MLTALWVSAAGGATPAVPACVDPADPGPWFRLLRADERFCDRPARAEDPSWFALKNRGAADGSVRWSLGGELRARLEHYSPVRAGLRGGRADSHLQYRGLVHVDARWDAHARLFAEVGYWNSSGRHPRPAPTDVNRGDVSQLFAEWSNGDRWIRVGRQQVLYGSGRLIGIRHAPNLRLNFDGARAGFPLAQGRLELFHLRPVAERPGAWNDRENARERVAGVYWSRPAWIGDLGAEAYLFHFERGFQRYQNAAGSERRSVLGTRWFGRYRQLQINTELILQHGRVGTQQVRAWLLQSDSQWRARADAPWALGLKTSQASGDRRAEDGRLQTFDPLYAAPPYLMQISLFYPANLNSVQPYLEWRAAASLTLTFEAQAQWRRQREDGYYAPPLVVTALDTDGRFLGTQAGTTLRYTPRRDLSVEAWASRLWVAGPLERAGARDTTFLATMVTWSF